MLYHVSSLYRPTHLNLKLCRLEKLAIDAGDPPWVRAGKPPLWKHEFLKGTAGFVTAILAAELARPMLSAAGHQFKELFQAARLKLMEGKYRKILSNILMSDQILKSYENKGDLENAYKVMIRTAPSLALEPLVVRSFLRAYVHGEGAINEQQIKLLAEAEQKYNGRSGGK